MRQPAVQANLTFLLADARRTMQEGQAAMKARPGPGCHLLMPWEHFQKVVKAQIARTLDIQQNKPVRQMMNEEMEHGLGLEYFNSDKDNRDPRQLGRQNDQNRRNIQQEDGAIQSAGHSGNSYQNNGYQNGWQNNQGYKNNQAWQNNQGYRPRFWGPGKRKQMN